LSISVREVLEIQWERWHGPCIWRGSLAGNGLHEVEEEGHAPQRLSTFLVFLRGRGKEREMDTMTCVQTGSGGGGVQTLEVGKWWLRKRRAS
jgi:hypothetical protein